MYSGLLNFYFESQPPIKFIYFSLRRLILFKNLNSIFFCTIVEKKHLYFDIILNTLMFRHSIEKWGRHFVQSIQFAGLVNQ